MTDEEYEKGYFDMSILFAINTFIFFVAHYPVFHQ